MPNSRHRIFFALSIIAALLLSVSSIGCGEHLPDAMGNNRIIRAIADSTTWAAVAGLVDSTFGKTVLTPQDERYFAVQWANPDHLDFYKKYRNVVLVATLNDTGATSDYLNAILAPEALELVRQGNAYVFHRQDIWAKGQEVIILVSTDLEQLRKNILDNQTAIYDLMEEGTQKRVGYWLFKNESAVLSERLRESYGWSIRIPEGYYIAKEEPDNRFVWIKRSSPDRWIFVYWEPVSAPVLSSQWLFEKRDEIGRRFYQGDIIDRDHTTSSEVTFQGYRAIKLSGLWGNWVLSGGPYGGPFRSYGFYDADSQNMFIVDIAVFAAGARKAPYLRQLEIIANTFSLATTTEVGLLP